MSFISLFLRTVNESVNDFKMIQPYSEPKISTGGVNITEWKNLTKEQQTKALSKDWFIYFSFRDRNTGKLKRQPHIKAGVNKLKTKTQRMRFLKTMQRNILMLLEQGFNPYADNAKFQEEFLNEVSKEKSKEVVKPKVIEVVQKPVEVIIDANELQVVDALKFGLDLKRNVLTNNSYRGYVSHINRFIKWLVAHKLEKQSISSITKKNVIEYLNSVLSSSSSRNRNNARASISSLFKTLEDNEIIKENFVRKINVLKTTPKRNKTYTTNQVRDINEYLKKNDPILLLFIQFVSFNFLRPIEVCRLKVGDLNIEDKKLMVKAKNKAVKIKIIPDMLLELLPDMSKMNKNDNLFTPNEIGGEWNVDDINKRDYFSKRFKIVKDHFGLGIEYGLYSFRHTTITHLYREIRKTCSPFEAKTKLMIITGHTTMVALEQYLRDIDAELPEDYSDLLKKQNGKSHE